MGAGDKPSDVAGEYRAEAAKHYEDGGAGAVYASWEGAPLADFHIVVIGIGDRPPLGCSCHLKMSGRIKKVVGRLQDRFREVSADYVTASTPFIPGSASPETELRYS